MQPLRNCILVLADKAEERTKSGLYINEGWKTLPPFGTVQKIGPEVKDIKIGDRVLYNRYAATILEGDERLITDKDVMAIVETTDES